MSYVSLLVLRKKENEKKRKNVYSNLKHLVLQCLHTLVKTLNKLFGLKYNSDTTFRKGEYVHKENFSNKIESTRLRVILRKIYKYNTLQKISAKMWFFAKK